MSASKNYLKNYKILPQITNWTATYTRTRTHSTIYMHSYLVFIIHAQPHKDDSLTGIHCVKISHNCQHSHILTLEIEHIHAYPNTYIHTHKICTHIFWTHQTDSLLYHLTYVSYLCITYIHTYLHAYIHTLIHINISY